MPVTFPVATRVAEAVKLNYQRPTSDDAQVLEQLQTTHKASKVFQSSMDRTKDIIVMKSGFVQGVLMAYNRHHNLVIRPDDVWIAIMSQLSIYIDKHAEELRDKFVVHSGKKELIVVSKSFTLSGMDFGELTVEMTNKIKENVKDQSLVPWALPNFSTSTPNDTIICSALLMATLRQYFDYTMRAMCGIPFITIEGTQADWQLVLERIDKLTEFGAEPTEWAGMLRAIVGRFVRAFDVGGPEADKEFWQRIIDESGASGPQYISGWMSAFCAWDKDGVFFAARQDPGQKAPDNDALTKFFAAIQDRGQQAWQGWGVKPSSSWVYGLTFDGVWFPRVTSTPDAFGEVDIKVIDEYKTKHDCTMLAGHLGISIGGEGRDTIHMAPQWFMFEKGEKQVIVIT